MGGCFGCAGAFGGGGTFWRAGTFWCAGGNCRRRCGRTFFVGGGLWCAVSCDDFRGQSGTAGGGLWSAGRAGFCGGKIGRLGGRFGGRFWCAGQGRQRACREQVATDPAVTAGLAVPVNSASCDRLADRLAGDPQAAGGIGLGEPCCQDLVGHVVKWILLSRFFENGGSLPANLAPEGGGSGRTRHPLPLADRFRFG